MDWFGKFWDRIDLSRFLTRDFVYIGLDNHQRSTLGLDWL